MAGVMVPLSGARSGGITANAVGPALALRSPVAPPVPVAVSSDGISAKVGWVAGCACATGIDAASHQPNTIAGAIMSTSAARGGGPETVVFMVEPCQRGASAEKKNDFEKKRPWTPG